MRPRVWIVAALAAELVLATNGGRLQASSSVGFKTYLPMVNRQHGGCPAVVRLVSPANGANLQTLVPLFRWDHVSDPRVTAVVLDTSREQDFGLLLGSEWLGDPTSETHRIAANLPEATTIYWRVLLACGEELGPSSPVWSFTTGSGGIIPPAPSLVQPADGSSLSTTRVTLEWSPVGGGVEYFVRWRPKGAHFVTNRWVAETQITDRVYSGANEWWVAARNGYAIGADSPVWEFTAPASAE